MDGVNTGVYTNPFGMITGISVQIDHEQISHVNTLLQSAPQKALVVYRRAISRGLSAGRVQANKEIKTRYDISNASLNNADGHSYSTYDENIYEDGGGVAGHIYFAGSKIPLYRFHPSPTARMYTTRYVNQISGWRVTTDVSAADVRGQMLRRRTAFIATMPSGHTGIWPSGHTGIWERTGEITSGGKEGIREFWGFSVRDMLDYEPAREAIQNRMADVVSRRINHELMWALD